MEAVLDLYAQAYDAARPVVCFDELPYQMVAETREPLPAAPGKPARYDYEYRRMGDVQPVRLFRAKGGQATDQGHAAAHERGLCRSDAMADRRGVPRSGNGAGSAGQPEHAYGSGGRPMGRYQAFAPAQARRILRTLAFHYTPKHGSLAEPGRDRVVGADPAVFGAAHR